MIYLVFYKQTPLWIILSEPSLGCFIAGMMVTFTALWYNPVLRLLMSRLIIVIRVNESLGTVRNILIDTLVLYCTGCFLIFGRTFWNEVYIYIDYVDTLKLLSKCWLIQCVLFYLKAFIKYNAKCWWITLSGHCTVQ